ncbi:riboflavin synthase [Bacillus sp. JCM 19046]|uniref:Riboflavin synthase n=1 Tax=Shouchella xiaoxiensis TaxID=766895 RepID=A0ABS2SRT8_9BACI|nr:riboflavin synthase [Shouchella xiaoxiensis]MBM7838238.1 riboflavin synthase [Shouchella xiaoxiensis]GAF12112.1 riboflavin synthase [Bacillus sp. JCM 19045]GAF17902.1 riboflavin synthase [Bacillus sp. JCM 19046]
MFTGIVEEKGTLAVIKQNGQSLTLKVNASHVLTDVANGDSLSVNGVCLTVTSFSRTDFEVDVMPETFEATTLKDLKRGSEVNLERAMAAHSRFGGHIVSGHIDGVGTIRRREKRENAVYFDIEATKDILRFIVQKGSVAIDGISLTVFSVSDDTFTISLIPHTLQETVMGSKVSGDQVNIECDMIGKYVEKMLQPQQQEAKSSTSLTQLLQENGFY